MFAARIYSKPFYGRGFLFFVFFKCKTFNMTNIEKLFNKQDSEWVALWKDDSCQAFSERYLFWNVRARYTKLIIY